MTHPIAQTPEPRTDLVIVIPNFGVGGLERGTLSLAKAAVGQGLSVQIVTLTTPRLDPKETLIGELGSYDVEVKTIGLQSASTFRSPVRLILATWRLRRLLKNGRAQAVSSAILDADVPARLAAVSLGLPHTCHLVNTTYTDAARVGTGSHYLTFAFARLVERITSHLTARYLALTEAVADYAVSNLRINPSKVVVVGRGVDTERFRPAPSPRRYPPCEFVSLGRLVPQKNHECAIRAFNDLRAEDLHLRVFGEGPLQPELEDLCDESGPNRVELHGPTMDVPSLLRSADVYVSSAVWEGQSNALLEAMASGCLLILSDIAVFREVAGECAFFFSPGDAERLAHEILRLLQAAEPALEERRRTARQIACERYDERHLAGQAVNLMVGGQPCQ